MKTKETRAIQGSEVRVKRDDSGKPTQITGYAAMFESLSEPLRAGKTMFREKIAKGAFADAIAEGQDVRGLYNHDPNHILGRTKNGTLRMAEDDKGLRFEIDINPDDPEAVGIASRIERGDIDGCSFGFQAEQDSWANVGGENVRTLEKCDLFDVGPVTYPAYSATTVDVRSLVEKGFVKDADARALTTVEYDDPSLVYVCRCAIDYARATFDRLQSVVDVVSRLDGTLTDADQTAADDCVSAVLDLIGKAKKARVALEGIGAEDDATDAEDATTAEPEMNSAAPAGGLTGGYFGQIPEDIKDTLLHHIQRMAESGHPVGSLLNP